MYKVFYEKNGIDVCVGEYESLELARRCARDISLLEHAHAFIVSAC